MRRPSVRLKLVFLAVATILAATQRTHAGEEAIQPGDKVKVINGPAPVKQGKETLATVDTGTELTALKVQGAWVKVTVERDGKRVTGWIHSSKYLEPIAAQPTPRAERPDSEGAKAEKTIQPGDKVKVVNGPAPVKVGKETLTTVGTGEELSALKVQGAWVKVTAERDGKTVTGWIHSSEYLERIGAQPTPRAERPDSEGAKQARIVEYGEYSTADDPSTFPAKWTFTAETTKIKIKSNSGFGMRFSLPGPYAEDKLIVSVTIGHPRSRTGAIGYSFEMACAVTNNQCIGEIILPCRGAYRTDPGDHFIHVKYKEWTLERKFQLSR